MDTLLKISFYTRNNGLVFIVFMMLLVVTQQAYSSYPIACQTEETQDEQDADQDTDSESRQVISIDQLLISSGMQVNLVHVFYEIMIIELDQESDRSWDAIHHELSDRFMKILFRQVISVNAP